jgi:hypothetical protein
MMQIVPCSALCQVSLRGLSALEQVPDRLKALVDAYVHTPQDTRRIELELLQVSFVLYVLQCEMRGLAAHSLQRS